MKSRNLSVALFLALSLAAVPGCKKSEAKEDKGLPPATGAGAPPAAKLPEIEKNAPLPTAQVGNDRTTGTTYPLDEAKIGPKMSGVVTKIWVKEGQAVKKGDPLFQQDARAIALQRDQAAASLRSAEVNLRSTQVEYDRTKSLFDQKAYNASQMDAMQARLDAAKVMVDQAKVGVSQANQMLGDATVRSPLSGVVTSKLVSEGETATMMPPTTIVVVQDQSTIELRFRLPEKLLGDAKPGKKLKLTFASIGATKEASIVRVSSEIEQQTRTFEVFAHIPNGDGTLKPGMLADVEMLP